MSNASGGTQQPCLNGDISTTEVQVFDFGKKKKRQLLQQQLSLWKLTRSLAVCTVELLPSPRPFQRLACVNGGQSMK